MMTRRTNPANPDLPQCRRFGFTVVELLVTISIIGVLMALLLPAVQYAREAARRTQCKNNLKQLSHAIMLHESSYQFLPSDGWGYRWIGEPDRGTGVNQPGGWIYQILPYIERNDLRQMGSGLPGPQREQVLADLSQRGTPVARCPYDRLRISVLATRNSSGSTRS